MNRRNFPLIALALGVALSLALLFGAQAGADGNPRLPLLTLLLISEFGAISSAIATVLAAQQLLQAQTGRAAAIAAGCASFTGFFLWQLFRFWPL